MLGRIALCCLISGLLVAGLTEPASAAPTWLGATTLSAAGQHSDALQVAVDPAGAAVAVWTRQDDVGHWRVQTARHPVGGTWSSTSTLSAAGQSAMNPDLAIDSAGSVSIVWERSDGTSPRIQERHSTAGGAWSATVNLTAPAEIVDHASVVIDGHGNTTVAWAAADAGVRRIETRHRPAGAAWSQPSWVSAPGANNADVDLAANAAGAVVAVWSRVDNNHWRTQAARRLSGGSWSTPVYLSGANENALGPVLSVDAHGTAIAAWDDLAGPYYVVMASRQAAGGSWSAPQSLSLLSSQVGRPQIAMNTRGDADVVWSRFDGANQRVQTAYRPASGTWEAPVTLSADNLDATMPTVAIDPMGDVIAAWELEDGHSLAQVRQHPAGGTWEPVGDLAPSTATSNQAYVALDAQGNAVAVWRRLVASDWRTQAAGLDAAGPTAKITKPTAVAQKSTNFTVAWSASDRWSTVTGRDVRYRSAPANGTFGSWVNWKTNTTATSAAFTAKAGRTYCFAVRAKDAVNNVGAWSPARCAATPLDDRALMAAGGWTRKTGTAYYLHTVTVGSNHGATLTRTNMQAKRILLLVTRCPVCGKVTVSFAGQLLGTFGTAASGSSDKALIAVKTFASVRTGNLKLTIASSGKPVRIDGVVLSRA